MLMAKLLNRLEIEEADTIVADLQKLSPSLSMASQKALVSRLATLTRLHSLAAKILEYPPDELALAKLEEEHVELKLCLARKLRANKAIE